MDGLELLDAEHVEGEPLVESLALALAHLVQEVLLEADLCRVHPPALREPVDVARRNLRLRHEGDAFVAEVGEDTAFQVATARGSCPRSSAPMFSAVAVTMDSIMKPVFGTPTGSGVLPTGGMATQTPIEKTLG